MLDAKLFRMMGGEGNFTIVMLRSVVETHRPHDIMMLPRLVERRHGIHPPAEQDDHFHPPRRGEGRGLGGRWAVAG